MFLEHIFDNLLDFSYIFKIPYFFTTATILMYHYASYNYLFFCKNYVHFQRISYTKNKKKLNLAKTSIIKELTIYASEKFLFLDYIFDNLLNFFDIFKIAYFF